MNTNTRNTNDHNRNNNDNNTNTTNTNNNNRNNNNNNNRSNTSDLPTVRKGSQNRHVSYLQNLLNARLLANNKPLWVDGIFGPKTEFAVKHFQTTKIINPDGIVGPVTWGALEAGPPPIKKRPGPLGPIVVTTHGGGL